MQSGTNKIYTFEDNSASGNHLRYADMSKTVEKYFSINFTATNPGTYTGVTVQVIAEQLD